MEEVEGPQLRTEDLAKRVLIINFSAIHVSIVVIWSHLRGPDWSTCARRLPMYVRINMAALTQHNICSVVELRSCTLLPCGESSVYPTASR